MDKKRKGSEKLNSLSPFETNRSNSRKYCHPFGRGFGFGAEFIGLLKRFSICQRKGIQFCLQKNNIPKGFAVQYGWRDYFESNFDELDISIFGSLNRSNFPLGRFPVCKVIAGQILRLCTNVDFFVCDDIEQLPDVVDSSILYKNNYWSYMQELTKSLWRFNAETEYELEFLRNQIEIPSRYTAVQIRRGDKHTEAPYVSIEKYVQFIAGLEGDIAKNIYVATDDSVAYNELKCGLGPTYNCFRNSQSYEAGYNQKSFNSSNRSYRRQMTVAFFFDLEMAVNSDLFIGSSPSNVYYLARYFRANDCMIDVENINTS